MKRFWVISPNAQNDGNIKYWLDRAITENKVFVGYDSDKKHGNTFENIIQIGDGVIIAQGSGDNRKLFLAGIVNSSRQYDENEGVYFRTIDYYLNENDFIDEKIELDSNNAMGESSNPGTIYELKTSNEFDASFISKINIYFSQKINMKKIQELTAVLNYKKQIILQGPPGTGKTKVAKEIAKYLCAVNNINESHKERIKELLHPNLSLKTIEGSIFFIEDVSENTFKLKIGNDTSYPVTLDQIIKVDNDPKNSGRSYAKAMARYVKENMSEGFSKLIQFHPAYTYEDFVRGITAKANGTSVEYRTENKILAQFAESAQKNYKEFLANKSRMSHEDYMNKIAKEYLSQVKDKISSTGKNYDLPSSKAYISKIEDNFSLRYNSSEFDGSGFQMPFSEFLSYCLDNRKEIRIMSEETNFSKMAHKGKVGNPLMEDFWKFQDEQQQYEEIEEKFLVNYVLIIDEINRANLSSVLGELIYALEYRGEEIESMYELNGIRQITLPPNLYIIGTMNTADRSVGHIDYAIRRRFAFIDVLPTTEPIREIGKALFKDVSSLFIKNFDTIDWLNPKLESSEYLASDFRPEDVWLGHSYFITKEKDEDDKPMDEKEQLRLKFEYEIKPILKEYLKDGILNESARAKIDSLKANA